MYSIGLQKRVVPHLFADQVARHGDRVFMTFADATYTYRSADTVISGIARQLHDAGVVRGTRVMLIMNNSDVMVLSVLAVLKLGAVVVPVHTAAQGQYLNYFIQDSCCEHLIADEELLSNAIETLPGSWLPLRFVLVHTGPDRTQIPSIEGTQLAALSTGPVGPDEDPGIDPELTFKDPGFVIYTSGTTGRSKGVVAPHAHAVSVGMVLPRLAGLTHEDRLLIYMPMFHASSLWSSLLSAISLGASVAVMPKFSASRFWRSAGQLGATQFVAMGGIAEILKLQEPGPDDRNHSLRVGYSAPLPADPEQFERRFGVALASGYGMTELPPVANSAPRAGYRDRAYAGAVQTEFSEVRIVDDEDLPVPAGTVGEIVVRPVQPWTGFSHYLGKPEETIESQRNQWFHSGDLGSLDDDGNLYFTGRKKEVLRRRGEFISPLELEGMIAQFDPIRDVAALPVPSELGEDDVAVAVTVREGSAVTPADIRDYGVANLPKFMVPRYVAIVDELPRTSTGKIEKVRLLELLLKDRSLLWDGELRPVSRSGES